MHESSSHLSTPSAPANLGKEVEKKEMLTAYARILFIVETAWHSCHTIEKEPSEPSCHRISWLSKVMKVFWQDDGKETNRKQIPKTNRQL